MACAPDRVDSLWANQAEFPAGLALRDKSVSLWSAVVYLGPNSCKLALD